MPRPTRRPTPGQLTATLGMLAERPGSQLDLIAEAGVEPLTVDSITVTRPPRRACLDCPKRARDGSLWCAEHDLDDDDPALLRALAEVRA